MNFYTLRTGNEISEMVRCCILFTFCSVIQKEQMDESEINEAQSTKEVLK